MDKNRLAVKLFNKWAELYQEKYMHLDRYNAVYDFFCQLLPEQADVLELACGPGNITRHLLNRRPDVQVLATDLSPRMLQLAQMNNPSATFQLLDARNIPSLARQFDGIVCGFVLPYLSKEETVRLIANASKQMNENGILFLSTIEGDYARSGMKSSSTGDQLYMYYHKAEYLITALISNQFEVILSKRQDSPQSEGNQESDVDLILIAKKV